MFRADLAAAEVPIVDENGKVLDFHGQRVTFITALARAGVSPTKAQKLARHSDVNLTMRTYTYLEVDDLASAVESLPSLRGRNETERDGSDNGADEVEAGQVLSAWPKLPRDARQAIAAIIARHLPSGGHH